MVTLFQGWPARTACFAGSTIFVALLIGLIALSVPAQADKQGPLGGPGGEPFEVSCEPNHVVIGFNMRSGSALDAIVPICIATNDQRTEWTGEAYEPSGYFGGQGGDYQKIDCQAGYAVRHLHVYVDGFKAVNHIRITCQDLDSGEWHNSTPGQIGGRAVDDRRFSCGSPENVEWVTGIHGRSGALVDSLGPICTPLQVASGGTVDPLVASDLSIDGKSPQQCEAARQRNLARCFTTFASIPVERTRCEAETHQRANTCQGLAAAAAAQIASDLDVSGKSAQQCEDARQRNLARCFTSFASIPVERTRCEAETHQRANTCQGLAAAGNPTPLPTGKLARVILATATYDAPYGNGNETGELGFGAVVTIRDVGDDWYEVFGDTVKDGRGYVYSGVDHRSLREE